MNIRVNDFANVHFTLISIIQGVVLSSAVGKLLSYTTFNNIFLIITLLQVMVVVTIILLLTYEYLALYTAHRYKNTYFKDIFYPMAIGLAEFIFVGLVIDEKLSSTFNSHKYILSLWYLSLSIVSVTGYFALQHTKKRIILSKKMYIMILKKHLE